MTVSVDSGPLGRFPRARFLLCMFAGRWRYLGKTRDADGATGFSAPLFALGVRHVMVWTGDDGRAEVWIRRGSRAGAVGYWLAFAAFLAAAVWLVH